MKRFWQWSSMIILCVMTGGLFGGCASTPPPVYTDLVLTMGKARPPISPEEVKIYDDTKKIPGKYEEVGIITAHGDYQGTNLAGMYEAMRQEAAKSGANGVILGAVEEPGLGNQIAKSAVAGTFGFGGFVSVERMGKATAIYVFPEKLP